MSTSTPTPQVPAPTLTTMTTTTHTTAPSLSPTASSRSQNSPSMPSSSSSHLKAAHSLSHSESNERQVAEARAFLAASMNNIGSSLDRTMQERARNLHDNSKVLEKQQKEVGKATEALRKENEKLAKMANEGSKKVKELGNVQNWAEMLERDFLVLGEWVRLVNGGSESGSGSESSWTDSEGEEGEYTHGKEPNGEESKPGFQHMEAQPSQEQQGDHGKTPELQPDPTMTDVPVDYDGDAQMQDTQHDAMHVEESMVVDEYTAQNMPLKEESSLVEATNDANSPLQPPADTRTQAAPVHEKKAADLDHSMADADQSIEATISKAVPLDTGMEDVEATQFPIQQDAPATAYHDTVAQYINPIEWELIVTATGEMPAEAPCESSHHLNESDAT